MEKTVKELAEELGLSKQRIQQAIDKLSTNKTPNKFGNKYLLNDENIRDIKIILGFGNDKNQQVNDKEIDKSLVDLLKNQIERKDNEIERLQKMLENQQILTLQAQERVKLMELKEEEKKQWWKFWK